MNQPSRASEQVVDEETTTVQFLLQHPDFFLQHPELLVDLQLGIQEQGKIVPLMERQVQALRQRQLDLHHQLRDWADAARIQERREQRMHRVICSLTAASTLAQLQLELAKALCREFALSAVIFWPPEELQDQDTIEAVEPQQRARLLERVASGRSVCDDRLPSELLRALFAENESRVASVALIPLSVDHGAGLLALGAEEKERYQPQMDTVFLDRLSQLVSSTIARIHRSH